LCGVPHIPLWRCSKATQLPRIPRLVSRSRNAIFPFENLMRPRLLLRFPSRRSISGFLAVLFLAATAEGATRLDAVSEEAGRNWSTPEGQRYFDRFDKAIMPVWIKALTECSRRSPDTKEPATFVFVISADGRVKELLYSRNIPLAQCMAPRLRAITSVPRPPRDSWAVALAAANHQNAERAQGPPDRPQSLDTPAKLAAYDKAIAPYIAKARATYPAAKKRFLAGLPPGHLFSVRVPLFDRGRLRREDTFVRVEKIEGGQITGTISNDLSLVKDYKTGQRITFSENRIDNWLILRPDGTEEGNAVGKFLDNYKPR
jgi:Uncharacterized protein conserved in bacteria (DUF2314)